MAGAQAFSVGYPAPDMLSPVSGALVMAGWTVVLLIVGGWIFSSVASYFPDSAGMRLYQATDSGLTPLQSAAVLAGWLVVAQLVAAATFVKRDA